MVFFIIFNDVKLGVYKEGRICFFFVMMGLVEWVSIALE